MIWWILLLIIGSLVALLFLINKLYIKSTLLVTYRVLVSNSKVLDSRSLTKLSTEHSKHILNFKNKDFNSIYIWNSKIATQIFNKLLKSATPETNQTLIDFIKELQETNHFDFTIETLESVPLIFTLQDNGYFYNFNSSLLDSGKVKLTLGSFFNKVKEFTMICSLGIDNLRNKEKGSSESIFLRIVSENNDTVLVDIDMELL